MESTQHILYIYKSTNVLFQPKTGAKMILNDALISLIAILVPCSTVAWTSTSPKRPRIIVPSALSAAMVKDTQANVLTIPPIASLNGVVTLPGSKSLSNRCLLLAALAGGQTRVENLLESDDIRYMLGALDTLGVPVLRDELDKTTVVVTGQDGPIHSPLQDEGVCELFLGNAGTAMRPLAAALCMGKGNFILDGVARMRERPIRDLVDGLQQLGADVQCVEETGAPPVTIRAHGIQGGKVLFVFITLLYPLPPPQQNVSMMHFHSSF